MEAKILKDGDVIVIYLCGQLDYETAIPLRDTCLNHLYKEKVVFNCADLSFVGSKGITDFIETMVSLSLKTQHGIKFCKMGCEFRRLLETSSIKSLQIYEEEGPAKASFYQSIAPLPVLAPEEVVKAI